MYSAEIRSKVLEIFKQLKTSHKFQKVWTFPQIIVIRTYTVSSNIFFSIFRRFCSWKNEKNWNNIFNQKFENNHDDEPIFLKSRPQNNPIPKSAQRKLIMIYIILYFRNLSEDALLLQNMYLYREVSNEGKLFNKKWKNLWTRNVSRVVFLKLHIGKLRVLKFIQSFHIYLDEVEMLFSCRLFILFYFWFIISRCV